MFTFPYALIGMPLLMVFLGKEHFPINLLFILFLQTYICSFFLEKVFSKIEVDV
jgi:hypothetical protein